MAAHREGVRIGKQVLGSKVTEKADVVIVSSHPADQDFWQSPKAMYGAEPALKGDRGGTMIMISPNYEGIGPHPEYPEYLSLIHILKPVDSAIRVTESREKHNSSRALARRRFPMYSMVDWLKVFLNRLFSCRAFTRQASQRVSEDKSSPRWRSI